MRRVIILALCAVMAMPLAAGRRRPAAPLSSPISIEFVDLPEPDAQLISVGPNGWVELSTMRHGAHSPTAKSLRVTRRFGLRITRPGEVSRGTATVEARLDAPDGRSTLRIDGQTLGGMPIVVNPRTAIGSMSIHTLEIEVLDSVPPGPLAASISWEVRAN